MVCALTTVYYYSLIKIWLYMFTKKYMIVPSKLNVWKGKYFGKIVSHCRFRFGTMLASIPQNVPIGVKEGRLSAEHLVISEIFDSLIRNWPQRAHSFENC
jgi:hypothetical protein